MDAGQFQTLAGALEAAGLVETLKGAGPLTVLAPTDEAFAKLPAGTVETLLEPENQERGAAYLISTTRRVNVPQDRAMTAAEFSNAMSKLSYEWASLPPGRYGQPSKSSSQMRTFYCNLAGC